MTKIFFDTWESLGRTFIIALLAYIAIVFMLRVSGKRTLSKMNAFDFIVTIALGSTLATVILTKNVALLDGIAGFFMLIFLQYITTYLSVRNKKFNDLIKATPTLLAYKGEMLRSAMKKERITQDEIYSTLIQRGYSSLDEVDAIILQTDGTLICIKNIENPDSEPLKAVQIPKR